MFYTAVNNIQHSTINLNSFRSLNTWLIVFTVWLVVTLCGALHCYFYSQLGASSAIQFTQSLTWSALRWSCWLVFTPFVINFCTKLQRSSIERYDLIKQFVTHIILFSFCISTVYFLFDDIAATNTPRDAAYFYEVILRELPLTIIVYFLILSVILFFSKPKLENQTKSSTEETNRDHILVNSHDGSTRVNISELVYIAAAGNYVELHTMKNKLMYRASMKQISSQLDDYAFVRVHRSYIVNRDKIDTLQSRNHGDYLLELVSGQQITVSRHYAQQIRQKYSKPLKDALLS